MTTQMEQEAREAPQIIAKQLAENKLRLEELTARIHQQYPLFVTTIARGSSDHAATFAKYLFEIRAALPVVSAGLSIFTLYDKSLPLKNSLVIAISQSGYSPDLAAALTKARESGGLTVALVNEIDSPLAKVAEYVIPLYAGVEKSVAATKSYLATLSVFLQWIAIFTKDKVLLNSLMQLPEKLAEAADMDWSAAITTYKNKHNTLFVSRGYGFSAAQEAALKFKETSRLHAEAFSSAELLHGPFELVTKDFPLFFMAQNDETLPGMLQVAEKVKSLGAEVFLALPKHQTLPSASFMSLPMPTSLHALSDPLLVMQAFYVMAARLSVARGLNPDAPSNLTKVTQTW